MRKYMFPIATILLFIVCTPNPVFFWITEYSFGVFVAVYAAFVVLWLISLFLWIES